MQEERKLVKIGNSYYVGIPKEAARKARKGLRVVLIIEISRTKAKIREVIKRAKRKRRRDLVQSLW